MRAVTSTRLALSLLPVVAIRATAADAPLRPPCTPGGGAPVIVAVSIDQVSPRGPTTLTVRLDYPAGLVSLPDAGSQADLKARVQGTPKNASVAVANLGSAVRLALTGGTEVTAGDIATVRFDRCRGAAAPQATDFPCTVEAAVNRATELKGARCSARLVQ